MGLTGWPLERPLVTKTAESEGEGGSTMKLSSCCGRTILLVGSGGTIGRQVCARLLEDGATVVVAADWVPQVVLTPHSAAFAEEGLADLRRTALDDVLLVLGGESPQFPVLTEE